MDNKAMFGLSYGLYVLTAKEGTFHNGCIINTAIQVTTTPNRLSITVNKANKTHDMIKATGLFNLSMLTEEAPFSVFQNFGFKSGKNEDKITGFQDKALAANGLYYVTGCTNGYLSCKVVQEIDLGTHTMFIADVTDAEVLSKAPSLTYAYYHKNVKPKPQAAPAGKTVWVCRICGYVYEGEVLPPDFVCPICKHGAQDFEKVVR